MLQNVCTSLTADIEIWLGRLEMPNNKKICEENSKLASRQFENVSVILMKPINNAHKKKKRHFL